MNTIILIVWIVFSLVLTVNVLYVFVFSVAGLFDRHRPKSSNLQKHTPTTLVIIPAYKEDEVILASAKSFLQQNFPNGCYKTIVIADELKEETIEALISGGTQVCKLPELEKRNKANAINYLLSRLNETFDNCIIMDADNIVHPDFVLRMNGYLASGAKVVQARRVSKNADNRLSLLDTYSEIINNHIFRKGQRELGFSSSLIGSGMAFDFQLFKELMQDMNVFSGFDKELELRILERKIKIEYAEDVVVFDEKVSSHEVFVNQRRRWIYAQLHFLSKNYKRAFYQVIANRNFDYGNKVLQFFLLPRVICLGVTFLMLLMSVFIGSSFFVYHLVLAILLATALFLPLRDKESTGNILRGIIEVPKTFANMFYAMLTSNLASKKFLHTPHNVK
jgi:cellulose synthase/poly-beta-1,6-N-acetylglucosamine synthase-like glycosyltransferase